jgi:hypothetical protein
LKELDYRTPCLSIKSSFMGLRFDIQNLGDGGVTFLEDQVAEKKAVNG